MSFGQSPPDALPIRTYLEDGARLAAILLIWGIFAAVATVGVGNVGGPGSVFRLVGIWLGYVLGITGLFNAILYVVYRGTDYWQA